MIQKLLPFVLGAVWGLAVFLGGLHLFFPSGAALERMQYELDEASDGGWQLSADKASLWRTTGLKISQLELLKVDAKTSRRRGGDDEPEAPSATRFLVADHLAVRAQLLPLLTGTKQVSFDSDLYRGDLSGHAGLADDKVSTAAEATGIDIGLIPFEGETMSLDLNGVLEAEWDLVIDTSDPTKSSGDLAFSIEGLVLHSAMVAGFPVEESSTFSKADFAFEIEDGKAKVKKGDLVGDIIEAELDGEVTLNAKFERSRLRMKVEFELAEHIDTMVKLLPGAKEARRDDGRYHFQLTGTLLHPSFRAERERRSSSRRRSASAPGSRPLGGAAGLSEGGLGPEGDDEMDLDERRKQREERIRERRERLKKRREEAKAAREEEDDLDDDLDDEMDEDLDDEDFLDDEDDLRMPMDEELRDVEIRDVPYDEDEDLGDFEDDF